ncbi:MAG: LysR family transcriptional regulator [Sphingomonas sp.]|uniref:LysR family transcriptional regulator n=1 Tax=Sphingomonas sp. TaxID=28214 RepID=UPI0035A90B3A|nr:LysR family transcriptional regulator [Sphingomonas sp.]
MARDQTRSSTIRAARPEFHQLATFLEVVETRSFAAAARLMGRTQPAVSQAIARLEEIYGGDLFERRRGGPLLLTPIGEAILPSARTILHTVDHQMTRAAATAQSRFGRLTVGFSSGIAFGPFRAGLADFAASSSEVELRLVEGLPGDLHQQLNERAIDLVVAGLLPDLASTTIVQQKLWEERLVTALHVDHALANQPALDWAQVASLPLILRNAQGELAGYRALVARVGNLELNCEQHSVSRDALLEMVGMGLGATILCESASRHRANVAFRPIRDANAMIAIEAVWPKADRNPLRHRLLNFIRKHVARFTSAYPINEFEAPSTAMARARDRG